MTMEVRNLLSQMMLDTSGHGPGNSTSKRPNPVVMLTPPPHKLKELPKPADTSSQVSTLDNVEMVEASLEGVPTTISPIAVTTRYRSITPPADVPELWEKANKALEELLVTKLSIDACRWRAIWELGMELCQNKSETAESIKEARAICSHVIMDADVSQLSKKPRPPTPAPSRRPKLLALWPSAKPTSSLPVRLPYMPAKWSSKVCWWLPITF